MNDACVSSSSEVVETVVTVDGVVAAGCVSASYGRPCSSLRNCHCDSFVTDDHTVCVCVCVCVYRRSRILEDCRKSKVYTKTDTSPVISDVNPYSTCTFSLSLSLSLSLCTSISRSLFLTLSTVVITIQLGLIGYQFRNKSLCHQEICTLSSVV